MNPNRARENATGIDGVVREWLAKAAPRLVVALRVEKQTHGSLEISFDSISPVVGAVIRYEGASPFVELEVFIDWEDTNWDLILNLECEPVRSGEGYACELCPPEERKMFPSLEALWRDHLFEPFLEWINHDLAQADVIGLYGSPSDGFTRATLLRSSEIPENDPPRIRVPLRI